MARRSQDLDYLRAIETLSESEESMQHAVRQAGPGGQAYDRVPTPAPQQKKGVQRGTGAFLKENAALLAGVAVFAASLFVARKYWRK